MYDLERDGAVMSFVAGQVYGGHSTAPELPLDGVPTGQLCLQLGGRLVICAEPGLVDMPQQRRGEDWRGLFQKSFRGVSLLAAAHQLLDLRAQVRVSANPIEERGTLALGPLEGIGRDALHLLPAFATTHAGAPERASPSR